MFLQHYYKDKKLIFLACIHEHGFVKTFCAESVKFPLHRFYPLSVLNKRFEREHRFNHNIESCLKPSCACSLEWNHFPGVESTTHFSYTATISMQLVRITLNNSLKAIDKDIPKLSDSSLTKVILFGKNVN